MSTKSRHAPHKPAFFGLFLCAITGHQREKIHVKDSDQRDYSRTCSWICLTTRFLQSLCTIEDIMLAVLLLLIRLVWPLDNS
ncbi:hypothetical protein CDL12_05855 [Handroanthus impetiginosus]|uniref:Uncharacterized protein n=1 Tax=Handroanthus impetiginosus TaxID=429701 RepID=A0A2G9HV86_9LAMI|nr:hypothetical protein CDL12_05855 [Handroanthus impetiginosus]